MSRDYAEHALQRAVAEYLDAALIPPAWWSSIDHSAQGARHGAQLKARGVKRGCPDIFIFAPAEDIYASKFTTKVIALELKAPGGRQSDDQKIVASQLSACGAFYSTAYSIEQVEGILRACNVGLRGSVGKAA